MNRKNIILLISLVLCLALVGNINSFVSAQAGAAILTFNPPTASASLDTVSEVGVEIRNVADLYAFDITLSFDPAFIEIVDADPVAPGVQVAQGTFLAGGIVVKNEVDPAKGTIRFIMTQLNPSEPKSGTGLLLVLRLQGKQAGQSALNVDSVQLATHAGAEIASTTVSGSVTVSATAPAGPTATPLPTTGPQVQITLSPDAGNPTETATSVSQAASTEPALTTAAPFNSTPTLQASAQTQSTAAATNPTLAPTRPAPASTDQPLQNTPAPQPGPQSTSGSNWIIIGIAVVIVAILFFVWLRTRRP